MMTCEQPDEQMFNRNTNQPDNNTASHIKTLDIEETVC